MDAGTYRFGPPDRVRFKEGRGPAGIFVVKGVIRAVGQQPAGHVLERVSDGFKTPCPFDQEDDLEKVEGGVV